MNLGILRVLIGGDSSGLQKAGKAGAASMSLLKVAAAAVGPAVIIALVKSAQTAIDAQAKLARQIGATTAGVQALERAANLSGIAKNTLTKASQRLNQALGEAQRDGISPAAQALDRLGLSAKTLAGLDVDERMAVLADRMRELRLNSSQQADVLKELGLRHSGLNNLMHDGGNAIRQARKDIADWGIALSDVDSTKVESANDAMTAFGAVLSGVGNQLAVAVAPILTELSNQFGDAARGTHGFRDAIQDMVGKSVVFFGDLKSVMMAFRIAWDEVVAAGFDGVNAIIRQWNKLADTLPAFFKRTEELQHTAGRLRDEIGMPPTHEEWQAWWDDLVKRSNEAAEKLSEDRKRALGGEGSPGLFSGDEQRKALDAINKLRLALASARGEAFAQIDAEQQASLDSMSKLAAEHTLSAQQLEEARTIIAQTAEAKRLELRKQADEQFAGLRISFLESQGDWLAALQEQYAQDVRVYQDMLDKKLISEEQFLSARAQLQAMYRKKESEEGLERVSNFASEFAQLTAQFAHWSKETFALHKAAAISAAVLDAYKGITKTLAEYPFPFNVAMGAAHAAAAFAQIQKIRSTSFGGGAAAPSVPAGGSVPSVAAQPAAAQPATSSPTIHLTLAGNSRYSREELRGFVEDYNRLVKDGGPRMIAA